MATLVRWQPLTELASLQNEMSRLMNGLLEGNGKSSQAWVPALDVWETENEMVYAFDLPGIAADYKNGVLEIHVAKPEQAKPRRIQVGTGSQATIEGEASKK